MTTARIFPAALAMVLREETGYTQPVGGPYVRLVVTEAWNRRRREKGRDERPLGTYVLDASGGLRRTADGLVVAIPREPDGMAFDDHPQDTGGRTGMGILQREYDAWRVRAGRPKQDVWRIGDDELTDIYRRQYWDPCRCDELEPGVAEFTFNTAVNAGVDTAARQLQMATGARVDGHIGDVTVAAANALPAEEVVRKLAALQRARYPQLRNFGVFGANWMARTERVEVFALARAHDLPQGSAWETEINEDIGPPEERTPRAHDVPPATVAQSTTYQAAKMADVSGRLVPLIPIFRVISEHRAAGKSLLSIDFALAVLSSPDVLVAAGLTLAITASTRHVIAERVRRLMTKGE